MATVSQDEAKRLMQVQLPERIVTAIKVAAAQADVAPGQIITDLVDRYLIGTKKNKAA